MATSLLHNITSIFNPETAHHLRMSILGLVGKMPLGRWVLKQRHAPNYPAIHTEVFGVPFRNPIGVAAGFDTNGDRLNELGAMGFGFVEIGTVVSRRQPGTPRPRLRHLKSLHSFLDNSGYPSMGLDYILKRVRKRSKHTKELVIGCNIGKMTSAHPEDWSKEYLKVFRNMYQYVDFFVINIASNTSSKPFVPRTREEILDIVEPLFEFRRGQPDYRPILLKISPDLNQEEIDTVIDILIETPLDGIEAVAGSVDMAEGKQGAVSGAMLTSRAIEVVRYISMRTEHNYPIIGSGGMMSAEDISAMIDAGASLVALNSGLRDNGMGLLKKGAKRLAENKLQKASQQDANPQ